MITFFRSKIFSTESSTAGEVGYLLVRVCFGLFLVTHGWAKVSNFKEYSAGFSDPFGFGSNASLVLTIFAECICAIAIALGFFTRLASIPVLITFSTIFFIIHGSDPFGDKELAAVYLVLSVGTLLKGSGKYSLDKAMKL
ncbi:MAG: DoxX family protein [Cyclobacteriaceae bacterium]